jgi:transcriptional regulator of acetoin/glycerol metabolism
MNANPEALAFLPIHITNDDGRVKTMSELQSEIIAAVVNATGSKAEAADLLGIGRSTLWRKLAERNTNPSEGHDDEL